MKFSRRREIPLLLLGYLIIGLGYAVVWQSYLPSWRTLYHGQDWRIFLAPALMLLAWLGVSITLSLLRCRETLLMPLIAFLTGVGMLFLLRLAGGAYQYSGETSGLRFFGFYQKQLISFGVGWFVLMALLIFWRDYRSLARYKYVIVMTALGLLLTTTLFGGSVGGQTLTLNLGITSFQPHDMVKLLLVIFMAAYLEEKQELLTFAAGKYGLLTHRDFRYMGPLIVLWLMVMVIIFKHDDLGAALLLFGSLLAMLYLGTNRKVYLLIGLALFVVGGVAAYTMSARVQTRIAIWQNPWQDAGGKGYQICQSLVALGNGRVVGAGLAAGAPERIPAIHTDMIYAAISEDLGLLGAVAVLAVFLVAIGRIYHVALQTEGQFGKLLTAGLATSLAIQTWIILAGVTKLIPLTGITLPFISYGGTSLVVNLVLLGIVLKIAQAPRELPAPASTSIPSPGILGADRDA